jgi:hypothetical protein
VVSRTSVVPAVPASAVIGGVEAGWREPGERQAGLAGYIPCATGTVVVTVISPATGELLTQVVAPAPPVACCAPTPGIDAGAIVGAALQPKPGSVKAIVWL